MMMTQSGSASQLPAYRPASVQVPVGSFARPTTTTTATTYAAAAPPQPYAVAAAAAPPMAAVISTGPQAYAPQVLASPGMGFRSPVVAAAPPPLAAVAAAPRLAQGYPQAAVSRPPMMAPAYAAVPVAAKAQTPWGGGCEWASNKTAFRTWVKAAIENPSGKERKELYGFLCECFLDADTDRDGMVRPGEFDFLIEVAASLPRRFGMAPSWNERYGTEAVRRQAREQMFAQMDADRSGTIGMEEWIAFAITHITEKVRTMKPTALDFADLSQVPPADFVAYCDRAVNNRGSEEYKSLYEHLFKVFVESDVEEKGTVRLENFDRLVEEAAKAPRQVGLAPMGSNPAYRQQEFMRMDKDRSGTITFEEFLQWALTHIKGKVDGYKAGRAGVPAGGACPLPVGYSMPAAPTPMQLYR